MRGNCLQERYIKRTVPVGDEISSDIQSEKMAEQTQIQAQPAVAPISPSANVVPAGSIPRGANFILGGLAG